jgi:DNA-binding SARP family transcriptional activator
MGFAVLGPLRVTVAGQAAPAGPAKRRSLLTLLLLRANELVPLPVVTEELWDHAPPRSTAANLRTYLAGIRGLLPADERHRIVVRPHGYQLRVGADELDAARFATLARRGQTALAAGRYAEAVESLAAARELWRGEVAEDVPAGACTAPRRAALAEQRLVAWQDLLEARLALGEAAGLRPQLRELVAADPVRERGWALLMTGLYRAGDPAAALRAYAHARTAMIEGLGIEPGPDLRRLQRLILDGAELPGPDGRAAGPRPVPAGLPAGMPAGLPAGMPAGMPAPPRIRQLPLDAGGFTGRIRELDALTALVGERPHAVVVISGMAGVGKTALAVHWAHQHGDDLPDGQVYLDLRGYGTGRPLSPNAALGSLLRSVGVAPERIPPDLDGRAGLWRSTLHDRRVLVVLDNARDDDQVRPLLPATGHTLVTSRNQLRGLVAREGARRLTVERLPPADAAQLLVAGLGGDRVTDATAVAGLVERCGRLPLALRIVAERAALQPGRPLAELAAELRDERGGLDPLSLNEGETTDVRAVLSWSQQALDAPARRLFRLLGLHPGDEFDLDGAAALAGVAPARAAGPLDRLTAGHLVQERGGGRYAFHDLLGVYAAEQARLEPPAERTAALARLLDWYVHTGALADRQLNSVRSATVVPLPPPGAESVRARPFADREAALAWFRAEYRTLLAAVDAAERSGLDAQCWRLAWVCWSFLHLSQPAENWLELYATALAAARRTGDRAAVAATVSLLAMAHADLGAYGEAITRFEQALRLHTELGVAGDRARTLDNLGQTCCKAGRLDEALRYQREALGIDEATGAPLEVLTSSYNNISLTYSALSRHAEAVRYAERSVAVGRQLGDHIELAMALDTLGDVYRHADGTPDRALPCYRQALALNQRLGSLRGQAVNWTNLGTALRDAGDSRAAAHAWHHALSLLDELHDTRAEAVRRQLASLRSAR